MATSQVGETQMRAFPALPFAPNEALHVLTYDFCEALSKAANDVLSHIDHEADNVSDTVRRASCVAGADVSDCVLWCANGVDIG